ncbi:uncharacterized protein LOC102808504 [Saccoglossus kowalevskii]
MSEKTKLTDSGVVMDPSAAFNLYIGSSTNSNTRQHAHDAHAQQITRQQVALKKYKKCATASVTLAVLAFLVLAIAVLLEILVRLSVLESSPEPLQTSEKVTKNRRLFVSKKKQATARNIKVQRGRTVYVVPGNSPLPEHGANHVSTNNANCHPSDQAAVLPAVTLTINMPTTALVTVRDNGGVDNPAMKGTNNA